MQAQGEVCVQFWASCPSPRLLAVLGQISCSQGRQFTMITWSLNPECLPSVSGLLLWATRPLEFKDASSCPVQLKKLPALSLFPLYMFLFQPSGELCCSPYTWAIFIFNCFLQYWCCYRVALWVQNHSQWLNCLLSHYKCQLAQHTLWYHGDNLCSGQWTS